MRVELYLDTANLDEVKHIRQWGITSGVTTNQKIFLNERGVNFQKHVKELLAIADGPVSIEVTSGNPDEFIAEAREYAKWGKNVVIKVPLLGDGSTIRTINQLEKEGIKTNATILMTSRQVFIAANAGASYASLFFRRISDCGEDAERTITRSREIIDRLGFATRLIVGSIRDPEDVVQAALAGAHIVTVPYKMLTKMPYHYRTEETAREFDKAWQEFKRAETQKPGGDGAGAKENVPTERVWTLGGQGGA